MGYYNILRGRRISGGSRLKKYNGIPMTLCATMCSSTPLCRGFEYKFQKHNKDASFCRLYKNIMGIEESTLSHIGSKG